MGNFGHISGAVEEFRGKNQQIESTQAFFLFYSNHLYVIE